MGFKVAPRAEAEEDQGSAPRPLTPTQAGAPGETLAIATGPSTEKV